MLSTGWFSGVPIATEALCHHGIRSFRTFFRVTLARTGGQTASYSGFFAEGCCHAAGTLYEQLLDVLSCYGCLWKFAL